MNARGKVPHFSLLPHPFVTTSLVLVLLIGGLVTLMFLSQEEGTGDYKQLAILSALITTVLTVCLLFLATSKLWFSHLWKKNSTHKRHHQHSQHHPVSKEPKPRSRR